MTESPRLTRFRRWAIAGTVLALFVIVLGAYVRLSAAGLGCPDWPGCYGHISASHAEANLDNIDISYPARPFDYAKAHKEMVHRYLAAGLGLLILVLAGMAVANRRDPQQPVKLPLILVALVIFQGLLGMWTVTLLLKPLIVSLHLAGGLTTLALLAWLGMSRVGSRNALEHQRLRPLAITAFVVLGAQIMLGGWTSTNYAALACPDFPTCQNSFWPDMDFQDAFVLWRGLGIDYEGGVLDHPARVAIHFVHRLGAIAAALVIGFTVLRIFRQARSSELKTAASVLGVLLIAQLGLGPMMVLAGMPLDLATAHNAMAALLVLALVRVNRLLAIPARRL